MPIFRELWGWALFVALATASLAVAIAKTGRGGDILEDLIAVGHRVEPLWVGSAILSYTITEGVTMLAEAFKRKQYAAGRAAGKVEGEAEGEAKGEAKTLSAIKEVASKRDWATEDVQRMIDDVQEVMRRNGRDTP